MTHTKTAWGAGLVLLIATGGLLSLRAGGAEEQPAAETRPAAAILAVANARQEAQETIRQKMQTRLSETFTDAPLDEVLERLSQAGKLQILTDASALAEEGIAFDSPVSAAFQKVTIEQVLDRILPPLGLTWLIENEVLKVTTRVRASEKFQTRVYNIHRLQELVRTLYRNENLPEPQQVEVPPLDDLHFVQFGGGVGGLGLPQSPWDGTTPKQFDPNWILQLIYDQTSGEWEVIDGVGGSATLTGDLLVVRQTQRVQEEVEALLEALERVAARDPDAPLIAVQLPTYPHAADEAIGQALGRTVDWEYMDRPLAEVVADIAKTYGIAVYLRTDTLAEEGIATDEPINLVLEDVTLASALKIALDPLGLTYYPEGGALVITTHAQANETFFTFAHDISDLAAAGHAGPSLLQAIFDATSGEWEVIDGVGGSVSIPFPGALVVRQTWQVQVELLQLLQSLREIVARAKAAGETTVATDTLDPETVVTRFYPQYSRERAVALAKTIPQMVAPDAWQAEEDTPRIAVVESTLVVRQPVKVQDQIQQFLGKLQAAEGQESQMPPGGMGGFGAGGMGGAGLMGGGGFF